MSTKAIKIYCLPLTQNKNLIILNWLNEYAIFYNYASQFMPSMPKKYFDEPNPSKLYTKWVKSALIPRTQILASSAFQAISDARANFQTTKIINHIDSPNIIKFGAAGYKIIEKTGNYGIVLKGLTDTVFLPLKIGDTQEHLKNKIQHAIESKGNFGIILFNLRDNSISIPQKTQSPHKFLKKDKLQTFIGVDRGVNNHVVLSAVDRTTKKVISIKIISGLETKDEMKHLKKIAAKKQQSNKEVGNKILNIQNTNAHRISHEIVKFALRFQSPLIIFEDLSSMKKQKLRLKHNGKAHRGTRRMVASWNYADLKTKTDYKLEQQGMWSFEVKAWMTSQICHRCGAIGIRNGIGFSCPHCGLGVGSNPLSTIGQYNSDVNASINIALRGLHVLYGHGKDTVAVSNDQPNENIVSPIPTEMTNIQRYNSESSQLNETIAPACANRNSSVASDQPMANVGQMSCALENNIVSSPYKGVDNFPERTKSNQKINIGEVLLQT